MLFFLENEGYFKKKYYLCSVIQKVYIYKLIFKL